MSQALSQTLNQPLKAFSPITAFAQLAVQRGARVVMNTRRKLANRTASRGAATPQHREVPHDYDYDDGLVHSHNWAATPRQNAPAPEIFYDDGLVHSHAWAHTSPAS